MYYNYVSPIAILYLLLFSNHDVITIAINRLISNVDAFWCSRSVRLNFAVVKKKCRVAGLQSVAYVATNLRPGPLGLAITPPASPVARGCEFFVARKSVPFVARSWTR